MKILATPSRLMTKLLLSICVASSSPVFAQVTAVSTSVNNKFSGLIMILTGVAALFFTYCALMAAFKFGTSENPKLSELKGLLIGGCIAGAATGIGVWIIS